MGNHLFDEDLLDEKGVNPWSDVLTEKTYRECCLATSSTRSPASVLRNITATCSAAEGCEVEFLFANDVRAILPYTKNVLCCDIHSRQRSRRRLLNAGAEKVLLLSDLMTAPVDGSGYNEQFGLLGSNKATRGQRQAIPARLQDLRRRAGRQPAPGDGQANRSDDLRRRRFQ